MRDTDLRHTFTNLAFQNSVGMKTLSSMLGHYSVGFTLDTYTYATTKMQIEASDKLGEFMAQTFKKGNRGTKRCPCHLYTNIISYSSHFRFIKFIVLIMMIAKVNIKHIIQEIDEKSAICTGTKIKLDEIYQRAIDGEK